MSESLTQASLDVFLAYAEDADNWSGMPWVSIGNVGTDKQMRGNLSDLVKKGFIEIGESNGDSYVTFTDAGKVLAAEHGVDLSWI